VCSYLENCVQHGFRYQTVPVDFAVSLTHTVAMYLPCLQFGVIAIVVTMCSVSGHIAERTNLRHFLALGMCFSGVFTALFGFGRYWHIHSLSFFIIVQVLPSFISAA